MASPYLGTNTILSLSLPESAYGTEAARAISGVVRSVSLHKKVVNAKIENLSSYLAGALEMAQTDAMVEGDTEIDLCTVGNMLGTLLMAAFGAVAEGGSVGAYTHTFTMAEALKSFSAVVTRGSSGATEEVYGLVAGKTVIKLDARGVCSITTSWMGKNAGARGAASPSVPALSSSRAYVLGHMVGDFTFNSVAYTCKSITITIDNKVEQTKEHGSILPSDAVRGDRAEVTIDIELNKRVNTLYTANLAGTTAAWSFSITGSSSTSLAFSGPAAFIETHDDAISKNGIVPEKLKLTCLGSSGSAGAITAVLTNADATYDLS